MNGTHILRQTRLETPSLGKEKELARSNEAQKIELLTQKFEEVLAILGLDLDDDSLRDTPKRIARMYVTEIFRGLDPENRPELKLFENTYRYHTPLIETDIPFTSFCEHHFVPIVGRANIAYVPREKVIGLSKLHRLVDFHARRPQVQERLTNELLTNLVDSLETEDVGLVLKAEHSCISCRGVNHRGSSTLTSRFSGSLAGNENLQALLFQFKMVQ